MADMILLESILRTAVYPALSLLPARLSSSEATVMLLSIGLQESKFMHRYQVLNGTKRKGPARGFWQFEMGGGVRGVMRHPATRQLAQDLCLARKQPWDERLIHARLEYDDQLAAGFARLLLLSDPQPLPPLDCDHELAWQYYFRNWRPGKPHRETWDEYHVAAGKQIIH